MSLATRCTACATAFRVVQDQLKVSEGWVRCGRCGEVFNALEGLFDLEREVPADWEPTAVLDNPALMAAASHDASMTVEAAAGPPPAPPDAAPEPAEEAPLESHEAPVPDDELRARPSAHDSADAVDDWDVEPERRKTSLVQRIDALLFGARRAAKRRARAVKVNERDRLDFTDARFDSDLLVGNEDPEAVDSAESAEHSPVHVQALESETMRALESETAPGFLRRAENQARWQRPAVRAGLGVAAVLLTTTLALQAGYHFRDLVAARWPSLQSPLAQWCALAACTIEPPRRIDDVMVESTALTKAPGINTFGLVVTLRSRGSVPVALPWMDLSLTDGNGKLVARKALSAKDFGRLDPALPPGAEVLLQTMLSAGTLPVTGYTVEIFYP